MEHVQSPLYNATRYSKQVCLLGSTQRYIVKSTGAEAAMILATRKTSSANNMDLARFWRNRNRRKGGQPARYDWIPGGAALIGGNALP